MHFFHLISSPAPYCYVHTSLKTSIHNVCMTSAYTLYAEYMPTSICTRKIEQNKYSRKSASSRE